MFDVLSFGGSGFAGRFFLTLSVLGCAGCVH